MQLWIVEHFFSCIFPKWLLKKAIIFPGYCLVFLLAYLYDIVFILYLLPCPSTGPKMFWANTNVLYQTKNWIAFSKIWIALSATSKDFVQVLKLNLLNINHLLVWLKTFGTGTICKSILFWHKKFGPAQTILGPVKGQGITLPVLTRRCSLIFNIEFLFSD